jgi:Beta-glucosidase-related glycosidases
MKKIILLSAAALAIAGCKPPQLGKASIDKVLKAMTLEEKVHFVIGTGMAGMDDGASATVGATQKIVPGAAGTTYPIERLGIPSIVLADGPAGLRIDPIREGDENTYYCTHFPIGTLLASTWNQELVESVGKAMGEEVHEYGADVYLAPALNIHRNRPRTAVTSSIIPRIRWSPARPRRPMSAASRATTWAPPSSISPTTTRRRTAPATTPSSPRAHSAKSI